MVVEEGNLKMQRSALRKVLSQDRDLIKTVHGRGYVFTGEVLKASVEPDALARPSPELTPSPLGRALTTNLSDLTSSEQQNHSIKEEFAASSTMIGALSLLLIGVAVVMYYRSARLVTKITSEEVDVRSLEQTSIDSIDVIIHNQNDEAAGVAAK